ncbi:MAG: aspartate aminotransferase family protein [Candidatus Hinthialibacter antarcticus]|nr:aspartate aminotransferase family protein [Candidatus Hinthialibacter antarcticus]
MKKDNDIAHLKSEGDLNLGQRRQTWQDDHLDDETRQWLQRDADCFLHQSLSTPCLNMLSGCEGLSIEDMQGRQYMDFHGNNVHQVGFSHPRVIDAIKKQLDDMPFCTRRYSNIPAIELAEKLTALAPGDLNRVLFAPGGTAAIGMALKLARAATGRHKTVSMWDSFHGASLDAISVGGEAIFRSNIGPLMPGGEHVPPPDEYHCIWGCEGKCNLKCADYIEYVLEKEGDVAAVIAETVRCTPFIPPKEYWQAVRAACDKHGALLILDEIPTCLGRTGKMFVVEHFDIVPDMLVIGKGLGGGIFPLAALLAREELNVSSKIALGHYTHEKNPVACAAAKAAIDVIEEEKLCENALTVGEHALKRMRSMMDKHPLIGDVRGLGLLLGIELVKDRATKEKAADEAEAIMYKALSKGLSFKLTMSSVLTLTPALTITIEEMDKALDIIEECLVEVERGEF